MHISPAHIAHFQTLKTPFYFYDTALLQKTLNIVKQEAKKYDFHIHYAMKANANDKILRLIAENGFGVDSVSGGEIQKALDSRFDTQKIVFAGVGKTDDEINLALDAEILCFNCESIPEIEVINELAGAKNTRASIALRINPNVDADTHKYISTGLEENKFGINMTELDQALEVIQKSTHIDLVGLHFHIGSQITNLTSFQVLCERINETQKYFEEKNIPLKIINVGGGLGINYASPDEDDIPDFASYFEIFHTHLYLHPGQEVHFELGRSIVAQCGSLIARNLFVKRGTKKNFLILDAGMTSLIRPMLYQAYHKIINLTSNENNTETYDIVGPICESTDTFAQSRELPISQRNDLIEIKSAGAYGESMASHYNLKTLFPPVYSDEI